VWGGKVPLPTGGGVLGVISPPQKKMNFSLEMAFFGAF